MRPTVSLRNALNDDQLLGGILVGKSWKPWCTLLLASMGEQLTDDERIIFTELTGRDREPLQRVEEFVGVIGRRGGKSRAISVLATYIAGLCEHPALVPGERGVLLCVAPDQKQADIVLDYIEANFKQSPILKQLIDTRTARTLRLKNKIDIEVRASDYRTLRGPSYVSVIGDEFAFLHTSESSSNPDDEILTAVRPGLATTSGPLFLISSPYARRGEIWRLYQKHYGPDGDPLILVAQAPSRVMNKTLPQAVVDRALERDYASAQAEYLAQFRTDIESFVSLEVVTACVTHGIFERAPDPSIIYSAGVDPSGGSGDAMTLAIGHHEIGRETIVVDCLREWLPPFSPEQVCEDFSRILHAYNITEIYGDRYAALWPVEMFAKFGITYLQNAAPKTDLYRDLLPLLNSCRIELLDNAKLIQQLVGLERRTARGGRDSIDHTPGSHDDVANAVAVLASINSQYGGYDLSMKWVSGDDNVDKQQQSSRQWRMRQLASALNGAVAAANYPSPFGRRGWR